MRILLVIISYLSLCQLTAQPSIKQASINTKIFYLEDKSDTLTLKSLLNHRNKLAFIENKGGTIKIGETFDAVWIEIQVKGSLTKDYVLEIGTPWVDSIIFYGNTPKYAGLQVPFDAREYKVNHFLFDLPIVVTSQNHTFYLKVKSKYIDMPLKIGIKDRILEKANTLQLIEGIFMGFFILMFLYNLFIYFSLWDKNYLYYTIIILLGTLWILCTKGSAFRYLWPNHPILNEYAASLLTIYTFMATFYFSHFLQLKKYTPKAYKVIRGMIYFLGVLFILSFLFTKYMYTVSALVNLTGLVFCIYMPIICLKTWKKGYLPTRFYFFGWSMLGFFSVLEVIFKRSDTDVFLKDYGFPLGSALEMLFFSFALSDKINFYKKQKEEAQLENLQIIQTQNQILETKVHERTLELAEKNDELETQNEEIKQHQEELTAINEALEETFIKLKSTSDRLNGSIKYAYEMQEVILPQPKELKQFFKDNFVLYLPKDVVSGDFYWFKQLDDNRAFFALADCTGHGVPGAFMTMIGNTLLHEAIEVVHMVEPNEILDYLNEKITYLLKQYDNKNMDGMDISLCFFERKENNIEVIFCGAKSSIYYLNDENEVQVLKGTRQSIGGNGKNKHEKFDNQHLVLPNNSNIYFTTDGFIDQADKAGHRFGSKQFMNLITKCDSLPLEQQREIFLNTLTTYQDNTPQRDDISVVCLKF